MAAIPHLDGRAAPLRFRHLHVDGGAHPRRNPAPLRPQPATRYHGHRHRRRPGRAPRHRGRPQAGHLGGLCRPHLLHRRAGHSVVLARHRLHPGPPHHLQVAAAHGVHALLGEPVAESRPAHLAGPRRRLPVLRGGHADDALGDARGAA